MLPEVSLGALLKVMARGGVSEQSIGAYQVVVDAMGSLLNDCVVWCEVPWSDVIEVATVR